MVVRRVLVDRFSVVSSKPFLEIVAGIDAAIGHPEMREFGKSVDETHSWRELEEFVHGIIGPSGFMEFARFDLGRVLEKVQGPSAPKILRIVIGNPLIAKEMVRHVHDAASYAPVSILIDERADGVHLSYDRMASYLAPYGNDGALEVARSLDLKVESLLASVAG
jgi:uncharacterized protein (DUF302 family)